jgi:hypothetical protein
VRRTDTWVLPYESGRPTRGYSGRSEGAVYKKAGLGDLLFLIPGMGVTNRGAIIVTDMDTGSED